MSTEMLLTLQMLKKRQITMFPGGTISAIAEKLKLILLAISLQEEVDSEGVVSNTFRLLDEVSQVLFRLSRWENLDHAKKI